MRRRGRRWLPGVTLISVTCGRRLLFTQKLVTCGTRPCRTFLLRVWRVSLSCRTGPLLRSVLLLLLIIWLLFMALSLTLCGLLDCSLRLMMLDGFVLDEKLLLSRGPMWTTTTSNREERTLYTIPTVSLVRLRIPALARLALCTG